MKTIVFSLLIILLNLHYANACDEDKYLIVLDYIKKDTSFILGTFTSEITNKDLSQHLCISKELSDVERFGSIREIIEYEYIGSEKRFIDSMLDTLTVFTLKAKKEYLDTTCCNANELDYASCKIFLVFSDIVKNQISVRMKVITGKEVINNKYSFSSIPTEIIYYFYFDNNKIIKTFKTVISF